ncbi:MAG: hypothetical protein KAK02_07885 [Desulfobulbaceae bacterium]|nr:hypothetical protein [Desulfobulbaceae bacterium]
MSSREALQILMLSPFYFRMDLKARKDMLREFCAIHSSHSSSAKPAQTRQAGN